MNGAVFTFSAETGLVCRMEVDKIKAKFSNEYEGTMQIRMVRGGEINENRCLRTYIPA